MIQKAIWTINVEETIKVIIVPLKKTLNKLEQHNYIWQLQPKSATHAKET